MSAYTEQVLIDKLRLLSDSQQSIQTLSHWIMYHRKRHHTSVEIWKRELFKAPKDRRLLFLWLANDIVQTSKKKGNEFIKEFAKFLEPCMVFVYCDSNDKVKRQIGRMLDIWVERNIYAKDFIDTLKAQLLEKANSTHATATAATTPAGSSTGEGGQIQMAFGKETAIAKAMRDLEEAAIAQDLSAEKVANLRTGLMDGRLLKQATHPKDIAALADEINEASHVLDQYRRSLESDLEKRGNFITMLTECIVQQENTMNQTTNVLQDCLQQLARAEELKNQIKSQYPSLPIPDRPRQPGTASMGGTPSASSASAATVGQQQQQQQQQQPTHHQHQPPHQPTQLPYTFLPQQQQQQQQQQGPVTPAEEPPVDDEDDVILDASATNPYKKQKLFSTAPAPAPAAPSTPSSSSTPAYSAVLQPPLASSSSSSYAAPPPLSAPAGFNGALPQPMGQDHHVQPLPYVTAPPDLHNHHHHHHPMQQQQQQLQHHHPMQQPQQWMPAPQQLHPHQHPHHHTHAHAHQPQPFADYDYDYSPPPH